MLETLTSRKILLVFGDIFLLYFSLLTAIFIGFWPSFNWQLFFSHLLPFSILYLFWLAILYIFGLYDLNLIKAKLLFYPRLVGSISLSGILGMIFFYLMPWFGISPKTNLILNILIFASLIALWRKLFYFLFSSFFLNRVAIIGSNPLAQKLAEEITARPYLGYKFVKILATDEDFTSQIQKEKIDTLIIAEDLGTNQELSEKLYNCLPLQVNFINSTDAFETVNQKIPLSSVSQSWFLENIKEKNRGFYNRIKRGMDVILAIFILTLSLPLWLFISFAVKLEAGGPVLYKQQRVGKAKIPFFLIKFRSMRKDAEKNGAVWAGENDSRATKIGKFLRRTHLDELPQMLNVLKGDISLVGPRPERPEFVEKLEKEIPHYHLRHLIKPGFTGWAQIKFRYSRSIMDSQEKFQYDLYYLKNRSLMLDLGILLKTFQLFLKKE